MNVWLSALLVGFVTALRFASLPALALLVLFSLAWKKKQGAWIPLWKLGLVLLAVTVVATVGFAFWWNDAVT